MIEAARQLNISEQTNYLRREAYSDFDTTLSRKLVDLEQDDLRLKWTGESLPFIMPVAHQVRPGATMVQRAKKSVKITITVKLWKLNTPIGRGL